MDLHFLTESALDDGRLADYRNLQDRRLGTDSGRFVAESELIVRKLLATQLHVRSVLLTTPRLAALEATLSTKGDLPVFVVPQQVMDGIAGYHVHRGCLAIAERPPQAAIPTQARTVVVLVDLVDVDNVGAMARNAAAFGADAILLSPRSADPFYRKAVRTSAGAVLSLPMIRATRWPDDVLALRESHGMALVGAALDEHAIPLADFVPPARVALLFGAEGPGLDKLTRDVCDTLVTIPMAQTPAVDSLNVATAGAVFLYHVSQLARKGPAFPAK